jgi:hypothetical protein
VNNLRERLAASVGGRAQLASNFANRTMRDLDARASREIEGAADLIEQTVERVEKALAKEKLEAFAEDNEPLVAKLIQMWAAYQHAGSRTASWAVTGPSNFPVRRMQKRMDTEHRRWQELDEACKLAPERAVKRARQAQKLALGPSGVVDAELQDLKRRLEVREHAQAQMKAFNQIMRREKLSRFEDGAAMAALITERGFPMTEAVCSRLLVPPYEHGPIGFAGYQLSNNNAEIKRLQQRIEEVERKAERVEEGEAAERVVNGVRVVEDALDDRLRLLFDGKPAPAVISLLKSRGFRWSPRNSAWQRQLTANARHAAEAVLRQMEGVAA